MPLINNLKIKNEYLEYNTDEFQNTVTTDIGTILLYAGTSIDNASSNFLLCDGTNYQKNDYVELYSVIGNKYGGTGTNFNVPNFKAYMPIGSIPNVNTILYKNQHVTTGGDNYIQSSHFKHTHSISGTFASTLGGTLLCDTNSGRDNKNVANSFSRDTSIESTKNLDGSSETTGSQKKHYPNYTLLNYMICYKT